MSDDDVDFFDNVWVENARPTQLPPDGDWLTWLVLGGRGGGKTRAGAEWVRAQALGERPLAEARAARIALVGETFADVREVMIEGVSGLLNIPHRPGERPAWLPSRRRLVWPNGVGSSRVDLQACKLEYSIVSPK